MDASNLGTTNIKASRVFLFSSIYFLISKVSLPPCSKRNKKKAITTSTSMHRGKKKENSLKIKVWSATQKKTNKQANKLHKTKLNSKNKTKNNKKPPNLSHHKKNQAINQQPNSPPQKIPHKINPRWLNGKHQVYILLLLSWCCFIHIYWVNYFFILLLYLNLDPFSTICFNLSHEKSTGSSWSIRKHGWGKKKSLSL